MVTLSPPGRRPNDTTRRVGQQGWTLARVVAYNCLAMIDMSCGRDAEITERAQRYDRALIARLLVFLLPYRGTIAVSMVLALASSALGLLQPYLIKVAIDGGIRGHDARVLTFACLGFVLALLGFWATSYGNSWLLSRTGNQVLYDLRRAMFHKLTDLSLHYYDRE